MQTIDITTTQNVTIEYDVARLLDRFLALLIDFVILGIVLTIISLFVAATPVFGTVVTYFLLIPIVLFYSFTFEWLMNGQSPGKKVLGIKVVKLSGDQPTLNDYLIRWAFRSIDIWFSLGTLGGLFISSSTKGQRLGDLVADTAVIKVKSDFHLRLDDILRISTLDNHEVSFPSVRQFSEQDMLLIKNVISRFQKYPNTSHRDAVRETVSHMMEKLDLEQRPKNNVKFLKTLISDYIVLTR